MCQILLRSIPWCIQKYTMARIETFTPWCNLIVHHVHHGVPVRFPNLFQGVFFKFFFTKHTKVRFVGKSTSNAFRCKWCISTCYHGAKVPIRTMVYLWIHHDIFFIGNRIDQIFSLSLLPSFLTRLAPCRACVSYERQRWADSRKRVQTIAIVVEAWTI